MSYTERGISYAERGIGRRLEHAHSGMVKVKGKREPVFDPDRVTEQRWRYYVEAGPLRDTEAQVEADLALLDAAEGLTEALRIVLFLAGEAVEGDPDDDELRALLAVTAMYELMEVARP